MHEYFSANQLFFMFFLFIFVGLVNILIIQQHVNRAASVPSSSTAVYVTVPGNAAGNALALQVLHLAEQLCVSAQAASGTFHKKHRDN